MIDEKTARSLEVKTEWNGKANVCANCGKVPETFYVATGHDHTDDCIRYCFCRENAVVSTPVIRLNPAPNTSMTPAQALHSALADAEDHGMQDVLIIGYDADGHLYIRSSKMTCAEAFFMANKAMRWAESGGEE